MRSGTYMVLVALAVGCGGHAQDGEGASAALVDASPSEASMGADAPYDTGVEAAVPGDAGVPPDVASDAQAPGAADGSLWINTGSCNYGEIGATFMGVAAYCQPQSAHGYYQCDELADRFVRDALHHPDLDNVVTDNASSICGKASKMPAYSVWGPGWGDTANRVPVPGDLLVYSGVPGHVAVIVGFADATHVTIMQQNVAPSVDTAAFDPGAGFFTATNAECWVHAESAPPAEPPDAGPCGCFGSGETCGLAIVDHEWWYQCAASVPEGGVDYGALYACDAGVFTKTQDCPGLCITSDLFDPSGYCGQ